MAQSADPGRGGSVGGALRAAAFALVAGLGTLASQMAFAQAAGPVGTVSGLPMPRYASLKSDRVNLREGPSKEHRTAWVFQRSGLPVEITAEYENWRKIRDSEGSEGWVLHSLLSGRRTALGTPWLKGEVVPLMDDPGGAGRKVAQLQSGVIVSLRKCDKSWCRVLGKDFDGFIEQKRLWGVYADERID